MKIIRKFARWVLRRDFEIFDICIKNLRKEIEDKDERLNYLRKKIEHWEYNASINLDSILPVSAVQAILRCLPNPNDLSVKEVKDKRTVFTSLLRGQEIPHEVKLESFEERNGETLAKISIKDLNNTTIIFPLRKHSMYYSVMGTIGQVETYYWDFNFSNIKIISNDNFNFISEFLLAQRNVVQELKDDNLL